MKLLDSALFILLTLLASCSSTPLERTIANSNDGSVTLSESTYSNDINGAFSKGGLFRKMEIEGEVAKELFEFLDSPVNQFGFKTSENGLIRCQRSEQDHVCYINISQKGILKN